MRAVATEVGWTLAVFGLLFLVPLALGRPFLYTILSLTGIHALTVLGLLLLVGYAGQVSFGHAGFMALGAYTSAILAARLDVPVVLGVLAGVLVTAVVAAVLAMPVLKLKGYYLAMATLAFGIIFSRLVIELRDVTGGPVGLRDIPPIGIGAWVLRGEKANFVLIWGIVAAAYHFCRNIEASHLGRILKGISADEDVVGALGGDVRRLKTIIFIFSAALASVAGSLYAHYMRYISPDVFSVEQSVFLVMMVFIGGTRHVWGALVGALVLNLLPELLRGWKDYSIGLYGLALVLMVLLMPDGLSASIVRAWSAVVPSRNAVTS